MKNIPKGYKQLLIYVPENVHQGLKEESKLVGKSMGKIVTEALENRFGFIDKDEKGNTRIRYLSPP